MYSPFLRSGHTLPRYEVTLASNCPQAMFADYLSSLETPDGEAVTAELHLSGKTGYKRCAMDDMAYGDMERIGMEFNVEHLIVPFVPKTKGDESEALDFSKFIDYAKRRENRSKTIFKAYR